MVNDNTGSDNKYGIIEVNCIDNIFQNNDLVNKIAIRENESDGDNQKQKIIIDFTIISFLAFLAFVFGLLIIKFLYPNVIEFYRKRFL